MHQFYMTDQLKAIIKSSMLDEIILNELHCGIVVAKKETGHIIYMNQIAINLLTKDVSNDGWSKLSDLFNDDELADIYRGGKFTLEQKQSKSESFSNTSGDFILLMIHDVTQLVDVVEESNTLKTLNKNLQSVYEQYNDDTICIADSNGVVEFAGEACFRHCGITSEDIIGMNMYDLERDKYFYPAATTRVLASGKSEVVMSNTKIGVNLITIGVPIFDEQGKISKVISISRDFSKELEIATLVAQVKSDVYEGNDTEDTNHTIVTCSNTIYGLMTLMRMVAKTESTVLLEGETGTGKGVFARYIHSKSMKENKPFVVVNCGAIADNIIESELFGYEPGTFTGGAREGKIGLLELANDGTLFLDEVSELPLAQQVKLLSVLQDKMMLRVGGRKYINLNFRLIVATNKNLEEMIAKGTFREDLYYRLNVVCIKIPPLAERKEDIPLLIKHFLKSMNEEHGTHKEISQKAIFALTQYDWPGNVRELENVIEMLSVITQDNIIDIKHIPERIKRSSPKGLEKEGVVEIKGIKNLKETLQETEKKMIALAFEDAGGNHQKVAELLGVDRSTITRKISQYGIQRK